MKTTLVRKDWPAGYSTGDAVIARGRNAHVAAIPPNKAMDKGGEVPVVYDDESGCYAFVPADDIRKRF